MEILEKCILEIWLQKKILNHYLIYLYSMAESVSPGSEYLQRIHQRVDRDKRPDWMEEREYTRQEVVQTFEDAFNIFEEDTQKLLEGNGLSDISLEDLKHTDQLDIEKQNKLAKLPEEVKKELSDYGICARGYDMVDSFANGKNSFHHARTAEDGTPIGHFNKPEGVPVDGLLDHMHLKLTQKRKELADIRGMIQTGKTEGYMGGMMKAEEELKEEIRDLMKKNYILLHASKPQFVALTREKIQHRPDGKSSDMRNRVIFEAQQIASRPEQGSKTTDQGDWRNNPNDDSANWDKAFHAMMRRRTLIPPADVATKTKSETEKTEPKDDSEEKPKDDEAKEQKIDNDQTSFSGPSSSQPNLDALMSGPDQMTYPSDEELSSEPSPSQPNLDVLRDGPNQMVYDIDEDDSDREDENSSQTPTKTDEQDTTEQPTHVPHSQGGEYGGYPGGYPNTDGSLYPSSHPTKEAYPSPEDLPKRIGLGRGPELRSTARKYARERFTHEIQDETGELAEKWYKEKKLFGFFPLSSHILPAWQRLGGAIAKKWRENRFLGGGKEKKFSLSTHIIPGLMELPNLIRKAYLQNTEARQIVKKTEQYVNILQRNGNWCCNFDIVREAATNSMQTDDTQREAQRAKIERMASKQKRKEEAEARGENFDMEGDVAETLKQGPLRDRVMTEVIAPLIKERRAGHIDSPRDAQLFIRDKILDILHNPGDDIVDNDTENFALFQAVFGRDISKWGNEVDAFIENVIDEADNINAHTQSVEDMDIFLRDYLQEVQIDLYASEWGGTNR